MAADPQGVLTPDDYTHFQVQSRRVADTYNLGAAQNQYRQDILARQRDRSLTDLKRQYGLAVRKLPSSYAKRGLLNSGLYDRARYDLAQENQLAQGNIRGNWSDQQQGLDLEKFQLAVTRYGAGADLNEQEQARRATAQALRAGGGYF